MRWVCSITAAVTESKAKDGVTNQAEYADLRAARATVTAPLAFTLYTGRPGFAAIKDEWTRLTSRLKARRHIHLYPWHESYLSALEAQADALLLVAIARGADVVGIVPLLARSRRMYGIRLRTLELPTHPHLSFSDVILDRERVGPGLFTALHTFLAQRRLDRDAIILWNVLEDADAWALIDAASARVVPRSSKACDYFPTHTGYEQLARQFSPKFKENLRRARRKLEREGRIDVVTARTPEDLARAFAAFLEVEAAGWKGAGGAHTAIKLNPALVDFYDGLVTRFGARGECEINLLRVDERTVAAQFCLVVEDTLYALKIGFDEAYRKYAPGRLLLDAVIRAALSQGRTVNLLSNAEWQADWHPQRLRSFNVYCFNTSARALAALSALFIARALRVLSRPWRRMRAKTGR